MTSNHAFLVPGYVYPEYTSNISSQNGLRQGDILRVTGKLKELFQQFYPAINHTEQTNKFVMVISQTCDLVSDGRRKPKIEHIVVCLVRNFRDLVNRYIEKLKPFDFHDRKLLDQESYASLFDIIYRLINNSESKAYFYLPVDSNKKIFSQDMVALLNLSFPFRAAEHYHTLLNNKVLSLKPEFQAKIGSMLANLYGRVATPDLVECGIDNAHLSDYIHNIFADLGLSEVSDQRFINYLQQHSLKKDSIKDVDQFIKEQKENFLLQTRQEQFKSSKKDLLKKISDRLYGVLSDPKKLEHLIRLKGENLRKEISNFLKELSA